MEWCFCEEELKAAEANRAAVMAGKTRPTTAVSRRRRSKLAKTWNKALDPNKPTPHSAQQRAKDSCKESGTATVKRYRNSIGSPRPRDGVQTQSPTQRPRAPKQGAQTTATRRAAD